MKWMDTMPDFEIVDKPKNARKQNDWESLFSAFVSLPDGKAISIPVGARKPRSALTHIHARFSSRFSGQISCQISADSKSIFIFRRNGTTALLPPSGPAAKE